MLVTFLRCTSVRFTALYVAGYLGGIASGGGGAVGWIVAGIGFWLVFSTATELTNRIADRTEDAVNRPERTALCSRPAGLVEADDFRDVIGAEAGGSVGAPAAEDVADSSAVDAELAGEFGDAGSGLVGGDECGGLLVGEVFLAPLRRRRGWGRRCPAWQIEEAAEV